MLLLEQSERDRWSKRETEREREGEGGRETERDTVRDQSVAPLWAKQDFLTEHEVRGHLRELHLQIISPPQR